MYITIIIVGIIPLIINLLLYVSPLTEKGRNGVVSVSKITFLLFPLFSQLVLGIGLTLNIYSYIVDGFVDKDNYIPTFILFSVTILMGIYPEIYYFRSIVKYDNEKMYYRKRQYYFSDVISFGYDKKEYVFVMKDDSKVKIDALAVWFENLYKNYKEFKNKTNKKR